MDLSAGEIAVYGEDRKTFQCHPSYKTIGGAVGLSKNTVKKHIDGLVAKPLITTEPTTVITKKGQKHNGTLLYTIRQIQEAVEHNYQRRLTQFQAELYRGVLRKTEVIMESKEKTRVSLFLDRDLVETTDKIM